MGNLRTVLFMCLPGEERHFTIRVGSDDFSFNGMTILMVPATLAQLEEIAKLSQRKDELEEDYHNLSGSLDALLDAMNRWSRPPRSCRPGPAGGSAGCFSCPPGPVSPGARRWSRGLTQDQAEALGKLAQWQLAQGAKQQTDAMFQAKDNLSFQEFCGTLPGVDDKTAKQMSDLWTVYNSGGPRGAAEPAEEASAWSCVRPARLFRPATVSGSFPWSSSIFPINSIWSDSS